MVEIREFQIRNDNIYNLPKEVYYQCIWLVKDSPRLRNLVQNSIHSGKLGEEPRFYEYGSLANNLRPSNCVHKAYERLNCIDQALYEIPLEYRDGLINNIVYKKEYPDFAHSNTWKTWKQRYIYILARKLELI